MVATYGSIGDAEWSGLAFIPVGVGGANAGATGGGARALVPIREGGRTIGAGQVTEILDRRSCGPSGKVESQLVLRVGDDEILDVIPDGIDNDCERQHLLLIRSGEGTAPTEWVGAAFVGALETEVFLGAVTLGDGGRGQADLLLQPPFGGAVVDATDRAFHADGRITDPGEVTTCGGDPSAAAKKVVKFKAGAELSKAVN